MFYPDKNFINTLDTTERFIFLKIICGMVACDKQVAKEELLYLRELALKFEIGSQALVNMIRNSIPKDLVKQARMIEDRSKALMLIKDLCMVANNAMTLGDDEIDYILDIADAMGIDAERVKEINAVVNEYLEVSQKACILLEQEHWT